MRIEQGMVKVEAGIFGSYEIMMYFIYHAQKFVLKATKKHKPQSYMVRFVF